MVGHCKQEKDCFPDVACTMGYNDRNDCDLWVKDNKVKIDAVIPIAIQSSDLPWNGYALGTSDLSILCGRGNPVVIALIGPPDSGKTSLLSFLYLSILTNGWLGQWSFAGSWTLGGWEAIVKDLRWVNEVPPSFPPHTSSSGRYPGLLHLSLRNSNGALQDVLFIDAPGEWFVQWSKKPDDVTSEGARWIIENSNALLMLLDSEALKTPSKLPATRRATRDMLERLGSLNKKPPIKIVWTKSDVKVMDVVQEALDQSRNQYLPHASVSKTTVTMPETIDTVFIELIDLASRFKVQVSISDPIVSDDPFLTYRGIHV